MARQNALNILHFLQQHISRVEIWAYFIPNKEAIEGEKPKPSPRFMQHEAQNETRAISINKQTRAATRPQHIVP